MTSPLAKGLFHAAVDMSGPFIHNVTLKQAESNNLVFQKKTGCKDVKCLRDLSVKQILQVGKKKMFVVCELICTNESKYPSLDCVLYTSSYTTVENSTSSSVDLIF